MGVKTFKFLTIIIILGTPFFARAEISVTEIAWMGTTNSANDEWIEIYNSGGESVNLSGWTLNASDGTPAINLSGNIDAGQYKLLERTDDSTYPGITALVIFTGALGNEGESLVLKNGSSTVQSLNFSGGWPAGDVTSKQTMQWNGSSWVTASETAGGPTTGGGGGGGDDDDNQDENSQTETETVEKSEIATAGFKVHPDQIFKIDVNKKVIAGSPVEFKVQALDFDRTPIRKGYYLFNMGEGTEREFSYGFNFKNDGVKFEHNYEHLGTYTVQIEYWETYFNDVPPLIVTTFLIEVISPTVSISKTFPNGGVELKNSSSSQVDISNWRLGDKYGHIFEIPRGSVVMANKSLVISGVRSQLNTNGEVVLLTPTNTLVSSYGSQKISNPAKATKEINLDQKETVINEGEVLGVTTSEKTQDKKDRNDKKSNGVVWFLIFIILILISVIAVLLLKKENRAENEYLLADE